MLKESFALRLILSSLYTHALILYTSSEPKYIHDIKVKVDKWIKHIFWQPIPVWGLGWHWLMLLLEEKKIDMFIINGLCICYCQWALKTGAKVANPIWPLQTSEHASNYPAHGSWQLGFYIGFMPLEPDPSVAKYFQSKSEFLNWQLPIDLQNSSVSRIVFFEFFSY